MSSTSETGHAKNVANFHELIECAKGFDEKYNPFDEPMTLAGLLALETKARQTMKRLKTAESAFNNATNRRAEAFEPLRELSTRIVASFSTVSTKADIKDVKGLQRKIYGMRAGKKEKEPPPPPAAEGDQQEQEPDEKSISVSQRSYDNLLEHFDKMYEAVKLNPKYKPNEEDLSVDGLKDTLAALQAVHEKVDTAITAWRNARISRGEVLYGEFTGLVTVAANVKSYVKSVYKAKSPQYKQVRAIPFKTIL